MTTSAAIVFTHPLLQLCEVSVVSNISTVPVTALIMEGAIIMVDGEVTMVVMVKIIGLVSSRAMAFIL